VKDFIDVLFVSHYRILKKLGAGNTGVVYEAQDIRFGRHVALKFLPDNICSNSAELELFQQKVRAVSTLDHPNICAVLRPGNHKGRPFIAMELMDGQTLKNQRAEPDDGNEPVLDFAIQITDALKTAHSGNRPSGNQALEYIRNQERQDKTFRL
jgi:non-specific serine/threonine protein kinase